MNDLMLLTENAMTLKFTVLLLAVTDLETVLQPVIARISQSQLPVAVPR